MSTTNDAYRVTFIYDTKGIVQTMSAADDVKDVVYAYVDSLGTQRIRDEFSVSHGEAFLAGAARECLPRMRRDAESERTFLTVLLHYALSTAALPSQRKVDVDGTELDIVIPGVRALRSAPESALILCIPKASDVHGAIERASRLTDNVWAAICPSAKGVRNVYSADDATLENLVSDVRRFLGSGTHAHMGIVT